MEEEAYETQIKVLLSILSSQCYRKPITYLDLFEDWCRSMDVTLCPRGLLVEGIHETLNI